MELILIRHGESQNNSGQSHLWDSPLSEIGVEQARCVAEALRSDPVKSLYCSPMDRALHTASLIGGVLQLQPEVLVELSEHGLCWQELGISRQMAAERYPNVALPDWMDEEGWARHWSSETREELFERMAKAAEWVRHQAAIRPGDAIALIIHGKSANELLKHLLGIPHECSVYFHHRNCGITRLFFQESGIVNVLCMNDCSHLQSGYERKRERTAPSYR